MRPIDMASTDPFMADDKFLPALESPEVRTIDTN